MPNHGVFRQIPDKGQLKRFLFYLDADLRNWFSGRTTFYVSAQRRTLLCLTHAPLVSSSLSIPEYFIASQVAEFFFNISIPLITHVLRLQRQTVATLKIHNSGLDRFCMAHFDP